MCLSGQFSSLTLFAYSDCLGSVRGLPLATPPEVLGICHTTLPFGTPPSLEQDLVLSPVLSCPVFCSPYL